MDQVHGLIEIAFETMTLLYAGAIFILFRMLKKSPIVKSAVYWRLLPFLPETVGVVIACSGLLPAVAAMPIPAKVAAGIWCGYISQRFHKILGQTILGDDRDIARAGTGDACLDCGARAVVDGSCAKCGAKAPSAPGGEAGRVGEGEGDQ